MAKQDNSALIYGGIAIALLFLLKPKKAPAGTVSVGPIGIPPNTDVVLYPAGGASSIIKYSAIADTLPNIGDTVLYQGGTYQLLQDQNDVLYLTPQL